ncbi:MAG: circularly permuted type 2 ATP-grasp protein [Coriobacteriia bacterium]|nr:circularly permuted type 2 ATP-grasp protein [Coriobacteriia bacterium]
MSYTGGSSRLPQLLGAYLDAFRLKGGDSGGRLAAEQYLSTSTGIYHGEVIAIGFIPKIYDMTTLVELDAIASLTYGILEKVTKRYLEDPLYRPFFCFPPALERLICLPTGYDCLIPIMRMDLFLNEESMDFSFCEFNTDGTSAMNEDREGSAALLCSPTFQELASDLLLEPQELFDGWVDGFLSIYASSEQAVEAPCLAIVDYTASGTPHEFEEFRRRFEARGLTCMVCDVPDLRYQDGSLMGVDVSEERARQGMQKIDAVYRRAVTGEVLADLSFDESGMECVGVRALVRAVEEKSICMIGGFTTHVAHCKQLFAVLHLPETQAFLSAEENAFINRHVPFTTRLDADCISLAEIKADKDSWIIKPEDGYASKGVHAGIDFTQKEWDEVIDRCSRQPYIVQSYCPQYATPNLVANPKQGHAKELEAWNNLTGLYLYGGRFSGIFSRAGQKGIIVGFAGGITVPNFFSAYDPAAGLALRTRPVE